MQKPASGSLIITLMLVKVINTYVTDLVVCKIIQVSIY